MSSEGTIAPNRERIAYLEAEAEKCRVAIAFAVNPRMAAWPKAKLAAIEIQLEAMA